MLGSENTTEEHTNNYTNSLEQSTRNLLKNKEILSDIRKGSVNIDKISNNFNLVNPYILSSLRRKSMNT